MSRLNKSSAVYFLLILAWVAIVGWLLYEQRSVREQTREALLNRARDISNTIALLSRSGGLGVIRQSRLEDALAELTRSGELLSVELLNSEGEIVAAAGPPLELPLSQLPQQGARWEEGRVTVVNLVNFGVSNTTRTTTGPLAVIIPIRDETTSGPLRPPWRPLPETGMLPMPGMTTQSAWSSPSLAMFSERRRRRERFNIFRRPPWLDEAQYQALLREQGLHGFVLVLSTAAMEDTIRRDAILRGFIAAVALLALGGLGFSWRSLVRSTRLQMRLVRAHEVNSHLREMNLAAAGLAHETRNPLNIVRGMAHMIAQNALAGPDLRDRAQRITEEVDRVTARLNEFINYSRPLEPRPAATDLQAVLRDVSHTLESDLTDKRVQLEINVPSTVIQADEALLRQILFNLLLNAIQAVRPGGRIQASLLETNRPGASNEVTLGLSDDGPGIEDSLRDEIFKPYFTTHADGTGLGLAVVKQIALAHHWEIGYVKNEWGGATFRLAGLVLA